MASIGAAAATALAPRATAAPDSFLELWADRGDALEGNYEALCEKWTSDLTEAQYHKATLDLDPSAGPPKAMMVLATERPVGASAHSQALPDERGSHADYPGRASACIAPMAVAC